MIHVIKKSYSNLNKKIPQGIKLEGAYTWPNYSSLNQVLKDNKDNSQNSDQQLDDFLNQYVN